MEWFRPLAGGLDVGQAAVRPNSDPLRLEPMTRTFGTPDERIPCCAFGDTLFDERNSLLVGAGNWLKRRCTAAFSG